MKEEFLKLKNEDDLEIFENKILFKMRNELYHQILDDVEMKKHLFEILKKNKEISKILEMNENAIKNILMIDGNPPIDNFDEE